ncbi:hypothetical protein V6N13_115194 [Hibiscus sabdariffa]|uniref:Uncharacterized protein n=1 Tax=Hibiscus sabdariffa TaxID=183260 RepID=A0ABR2CR10_9ROSI
MNSPEELLVSSAFGQYYVRPECVEILNDIFHSYPDTDKHFLASSKAVRRFYMNLLADTAVTIEANCQILEVVEDAATRVQDMERRGLNLVWLKNKLRMIRANLQ